MKRYSSEELPNGSLVYIVLDNQVHHTPVQLRTLDNQAPERWVTVIDVEVNGKYHNLSEGQFFTELWQIREELKRRVGVLNEEITKLFWGQNECPAS